MIGNWIVKNKIVIKVASWMGIESPWGDQVAVSDVNSIQNPIFAVFNSLYWIGTALAIVIIIYGGVVLITSSGEESKIKSGQTIIQNALIGLVVLFLVKAIIQVIVNWVQGL